MSYDCVDVREFLETMGGMPGSGQDASVGINAAFAYAKTRPYGGTVYAPAGDYALVNPLYINHSNDTSRLDKLINFEGDGSGQTRFFCWGPTSTGMYFQGKASLPENHFHMKGMRFVGNGWGYGLCARIAAFGEFSDLIFEGFGVAVDFQDVEQCLVKDLYTMGNQDGVIVHASQSTTDGNSNTFINYTSSNNARGMTYNNANAVSFLNGSFQYNGTMSGDPMASYGAKFVNPGTGYGNVQFTGTVFEGNKGCADLWIHFGAGEASMSLMSASFIRISPTQHTRNNLWVTGNSRSSLAVMAGTTFKGFSGYQPSASRKYILNQNPYTTTWVDPSVIMQTSIES